MIVIALQPLPTWDLEHGIFRAWWFDPFVATLSFLIFIHWYWYHERRLGLSSVQALRNPNTFQLQSMPVYAGVGYWTGIYLWRILVPPAAATLPDGIPSSLMAVDEWMYLAMEVMTGVVLYDAIFFWVHMAMHEISWLRCFHRDHHILPDGRTVLECRDVLRHGVVDATLQVLVNILVQRHTPVSLLWWWGTTMTTTTSVKSRLARAIHNVFVIWFLVESHTAAPTPYIWRRWFVGIREHGRHHSNNPSLSGGAGGQESQQAQEHAHANDGVASTVIPSSSSSSSSPYFGRNHRYQQFFGYLDDLRCLLQHGRYRCRIRVEKKKTP